LFYRLTSTQDVDAQGLGIMLLADIKQAFTDD
jgi:hypothetical protein